MKKARKKRIVRRKRRISEREIMRIKRKLKKSARKLRLGAKRTGAYVYGTLRRIVGNPGYGWAKNDIKLLGTSLKIEKGERVRYVEATNIPGGGVFIRPYYPKGIWKMQSEDTSIHLSPAEFSEEISMSEPRGEYRPTPQVAPAWKYGIYTGRGVVRKNPGGLKILGYRSGMQYLTDGKDVYRRDKMDMKHGGMKWYSTYASFPASIRAYGPLTSPRGLRGNPARGFSRTGFDTSSGTTYGQLASFLASGRNKENRTIASNTYVIRYGDGSIGVVLYQTRILHYHPNGEVDVNFGGWLTPTTFNRVNALIPYGWRIGKKKGQLVIHNYLGEKAVVRQPKGAEGYAVRLTPEKAYLII